MTHQEFKKTANRSQKSIFSTTGPNFHLLNKSRNPLMSNNNFNAQQSTSKAYSTAGKFGLENTYSDFNLTRKSRNSPSLYQESKMTHSKCHLIDLEGMCDDATREVHKDYKSRPVTVDVSSVKNMGVNLSTMRLNEYLREIFDKNYDKNMHKKITRQCAEFKQGLRSINEKTAAQKEREKEKERLGKEKEAKA